MPRSGSGTYTLPSGNPVVTGTTIESNWANTTLSDIATTLSDSLSRSGQGGMTAALRVADGTQGAPGVGFANETGSGFYRAGTGEVWAVVQGAQTLNLDANGVTVPSDKATSIEGTFVFNETGADKDARFEGDTDANLLFLDASTDRVGVGTSTPDAKLTVNGVGAFGAGAVGTPSISNTGDLNTGIWFPAADTVAVSTGGAEVARFDSSGNLGIGTSSPGQKLTVQGGVNVTNSATLPAAQGSMLFSYESAVNRCYMGDGTGYSFAFSKRAASVTTDLMTLTDTGNLGLGVTPSAWDSAGNLQLATGKNISAGSGIGLYGNAYFNSGWKYITTNPASGYSPSGGAHQWYVAPSGTAGNAITFTQAMTLDASGQLSVGTTTALVTAANRGNVTINGSTSSIVALGVGGTATASFYADASVVNVSARTNIPLLLSTNDTERARITSGGELCIGATSSAAGARLFLTGVGSTNATWINYFENSSGTRCFAIEGDGRIYTGTAATSPYNNTTASAANMFVDSAGILLRSTSSLKYKTDVQDATHGLAEVMQLRPVTYKGKTDGDTVFGGLIAEEVHAAGLTEFVQYAEDGSPDALAYGNMVSVLVKAIQEQQALITALTARVAALEAQP